MTAAAFSFAAGRRLGSEGTAKQGEARAEEQQQRGGTSAGMNVSASAAACDAAASRPEVAGGGRSRRRPERAAGTPPRRSAILPRSGGRITRPRSGRPPPPAAGSRQSQKIVSRRDNNAAPAAAAASEGRLGPAWQAALSGWASAEPPERGDERRVARREGLGQASPAAQSPPPCARPPRPPSPPSRRGEALFEGAYPAEVRDGGHPGEQTLRRADGRTDGGCFPGARTCAFAAQGERARPARRNRQGRRKARGSGERGRGRAAHRAAAAALPAAPGHQELSHLLWG